jgi:hypothetical protein
LKLFKSNTISVCTVLLHRLLHFIARCRLSSITDNNGIKLEKNDRSRWGRILERALTTTPLDSRAYRAGIILNPLRGLTAVENNMPQSERNVPSPVRPTDKIGRVLFFKLY